MLGCVGVDTSWFALIFWWWRVEKRFSQLSPGVRNSNAAQRNRVVIEGNAIFAAGVVSTGISARADCTPLGLLFFLLHSTYTGRAGSGNPYIDAGKFRRLSPMFEYDARAYLHDRGLRSVSLSRLIGVGHLEAGVVK